MREFFAEVVLNLLTIATIIAIGFGVYGSLATAAGYVREFVRSLVALVA